MNQDNPENIFYVMLTMVSQQTMPVLLPFLQVDSPKFEEVYFLHTGEFKSQYTYVCDYLQEEAGYKPERLIWYEKRLHNADLEINTVIFDELIDELAAKAKKQGRVIKILCNLTPGTKPMAFGMRESSRERDYCYHIYVDSQNGNILDYCNFFGGDRQYIFNMKLSLRQYLEAHGLLEVSGRIPDHKMRRASLFIANHLEKNGRQLRVGEVSFFGAVRQTVDNIKEPLKKHYDALNRQNNTRNNNSSRLYPPDLVDLDDAVEEWLNSPPDDPKHVLGQELKAGLLIKVEIYPHYAWKLAEDLRKLGKIKGNRWIIEENRQINEGGRLVGLEIRFGSFLGLALLHGFWLEYYIYELLCEKYAICGQEEGVEGILSQSVRFKWDNFTYSPVNPENELDVLLLRSGKLSIFSCKSGGNLRTGENNQSIYHLDSIAGRIGLFLKKYVVVGQSEDSINDFKNRATSSKIEVIALDKLQEFIKQL